MHDTVAQGYMAVHLCVSSETYTPDRKNSISYSGTGVKWFMTMSQILEHQNARKWQ